ncbi:hypothetical protein SAMN05444336_11322 [Albimonas donghaensis]|uniref:Carbohydrate binding domain-containing protein n=1 Tax=Albimonas donghaensis TaxID=356660 RepID=A0A1H3FN79_9RHOB|nr:hypothetical protein [Albimonas donghaensis]SDX92257.1 hypothetical protein SAMN05444336_11322 [Albimonas donghaensis]
MPVTPPAWTPAHARPPRGRGRRLAGLAILILSGLALLGAGSEGARSQEARFAVTETVINPDLPPVAATLIGRGLANGSRLVEGGGFEPTIYRNGFLATEDAPDRVIGDPQAISRYYSLRDGALDGAEVDVWRIENGAFRLVRRDRIAEGGFHASGWDKVGHGKEQMIPGDRTRIELSWEPWYRPDADTWFMLRAIGPDGALSPASETAQARSPAGDARRKKEAFPGMIAFGDDLKIGAKGAATAPAAPRDLEVTRDADGASWLSWRPGQGGTKAKGYALYRSWTPPARHAGHFLGLEGGAGGAAVRKGDLIMLRKAFTELSRESFANDRIWDSRGRRALLTRAITDWPDPGADPDERWSLRPHAAGTPVTDPGETYLELRLGFGKTATLQGGVVGSPDQDWYEVLRPGQAYRVEAWLRSERPGRAVFGFDNSGAYRKSIRPIIFETGPTWRKVSAEFTPPTMLDKGRNGLVLTLTGPGVFDVDNFRIYRADTPYLDLMSEDYDRIEASGMSALRTHALVRTEVKTYDLAQLTNAGGLAGGTDRSATLPQQLGIMDRAGVDPWLQIEPHLTPEEWTGLVEYLAAPAGAGPWAAKRARQGRAAPWTDAFDRIYFELGNETWNGIFRPWIFEGMRDAVTGDRYKAGEVYGMFQEQVIAALRASPWWAKAGLDDKVTFVIGGRNGSSYGSDAARFSPGSDLITVAPYIGGWDAGQNLTKLEPASYFTHLNWVSQSSLPKARQQVEYASRLSRETGRRIEVGTYESGPGYVMKVDGKRLNDEQSRIQEQVMKSQATGTATLDNFLAQAEVGYRLQNFFAFDDGLRWTTHALWQDGGQTYPSWKLISLLNREGLGDMVKVDTLATPTADLPKARRRREVDDAPLTAVYATRKGDRLNVFVLSRRIPDYPVKGDDGCTPVEIALPFRSAAKVTLHRMAAPYDAENVTADNVKIETLDLAPPADPARFKMGEATGAPACGLPAAAAFLYVFEGVK